MASIPKMETLYTEDEYLALERASQERREYLDGQIFLMAGESPAHGDICTNSSGHLYNQLRGGSCRSIGCTLRLSDVYDRIVFADHLIEDQLEPAHT